MNLAELQRGMRAHLLAGDPGVAAHIRVDAAARLHVYHHAYRAQLVAGLRDTYEKTRAWLGDARFDAAALDYVEHHPPHSWTLNDYGEDFASALQSSWPDDPEIADLARLEHALRRAFDGVDAVPIDVASLAAVEWDAAVLRFAPTLRVMPITTNAAAIWSALDAGNVPPEAAGLGAAAVRVWRQNWTCKFRSIDAYEQRALALALSGAPFGEICEAIAVMVDGEDAASAIGTLLTTWLHDGLVTAVA